MRFTPVIAGLAALSLLAACGDSNDATDSTTADTTVDTSATDGTNTDGTVVDGTVPPNADKPEVVLPEELPTELVVTVITPGSGPSAAAGDTVIVDYVGVRSEDGTEFDNSYDTGSPFPVALGAEPAQVIEGWDQGLIGAQAGSRIQLDIPADLAYGDTPQGDIIQAGDALTFVIDVRAVVPASDPADAPDVTVEAAENSDELISEDLIEGAGAGFEDGDTVVIHLVAFSAADGSQLFSSWEQGGTIPFEPGAGTTLPGLEQAVIGMKVGGRRQVQIPFVDAWGEAGNEQLLLPPSTDLIVIIDLIASY